MPALSNCPLIKDLFNSPKSSRRSATPIAKPSCSTSKIVLRINKQMPEPNTDLPKFRTAAVHQRVLWQEKDDENPA